MKRFLFCLAATLLISFNANSQIINNWRGPDRDGKYLETNLLKSWPEGGPQMLWSYESLGKGFTSTSIDNGKIYITGIEGETGYLHILTLNGQLIKKIAYGSDVFSPSGFPGSRSSPTIAGNLCYIVSGFGKLVCIDTKEEKIIWSKELFSDFDGVNIRFSFTENLLINGKLIYVSPGGIKNNIVALDRFTGNLIWSSEGKGNVSAYCSPLLIESYGRKLLVNMMSFNTIAVDAATGALVWSYPYANTNKIHPNTPIYKDNSLYIFSGYGYGSQRIKLNADGSQPTNMWTNATIDPQFGGAILKNGFIYASGDRNRKWFCADWATGEIKFETTELDKGAIIEADDLLYVYTEKGDIALLEPLAGSFKIIGKAQIKLGTDQHWAHPVINNGVLYIRHGTALMAFNIKK
ncbi:MAG TPA: PQQ-binding-like beta-propeller repeat protein [Bacteroidales bacterium]|nr:PQQ-binding-like beta-propeller repeat protein [Bacteroidales bacterium]